MEQLEPLTLIRMATEVAREPSKIVTFPPTAGFRPFKHFFVKEAVKHPAKANLHMIRWIIEKFTEEGDVILDPMAGTYSTCIMAGLLNRNSVGVEYEDKFYKMGLENVKQLQQQPSLEARGKIVVLKGDARKLSLVLVEHVDEIMFSPPYAKAISKQGGETSKYLKPEKDGCKVGNSSSLMRKYSDDPDNIGNLRYGKIDAIITSPPYAHQGSVYKGLLKRVERAYRAGKITKEQYEHFKGRKAYKEEAAEEYGRSKDQIGNLKYGKIDAIVTSPPYEASRKGDKLDEARSIYEPRYKGNTRKAKQDFKRHDYRTGYSNNSRNVGNLKGETYLSAMLQVYSECYKVLKPNGLMILITKNFIRKKKVVRLDMDTIKLCRHAGFTLIDRWYRKLTNLSFWVIIYRKRFPDVEKVDFEDILIFKKVL